MSTKNEQLTSVKIDSDLFEDFKIKAIRNKFSFKKLAERAMFLYLTDVEFQKKIHQTRDISLPKDDLNLD